MRNAWIIANREIRAIFTQPIAYVVALVLIFMSGLIFVQDLAGYVLNQQFGQSTPPPTVAGVMGFYTFLTLFVAPAITMRLLSEEQRSGTIEVLMTLPVRDGEVVVGKFLAALLFFLVTLVFTFVYPLVLLRFGNPDLGPMLTTYLGTILSVAAILAIGVLASALSENQIVAYMVTFGVIVALYLSPIVSQSLVNNPTIGTIFDELSFPSHASRFAQGLIVAKDVVYYVGLTAVALFAAARVLESRRWR